MSMFHRKIIEPSNPPIPKCEVNEITDEFVVHDQRYVDPLRIRIENGELVAYRIGFGKVVTDPEIELDIVRREPSSDFYISNDLKIPAGVVLEFKRWLENELELERVRERAVEEVVKEDRHQKIGSDVAREVIDAAQPVINRLTVMELSDKDRRRLVKFGDSLRKLESLLSEEPDEQAPESLPTEWELEVYRWAVNTIRDLHIRWLTIPADVLSDFTNWLEGEIAKTTEHAAAGDVTSHQPRRGDEVEAWIKRYRDRFLKHPADPISREWVVLDRLLDRYQECADYGLSLCPEDDEQGDP